MRAIRNSRNPYVGPEVDAARQEARATSVATSERLNS